MKIAFSRLQDLVSRVVPDPTLRLQVLTTSMALAFSRTASLPSAPVPSPAAYYNTQVLTGMDEAMSKMNEQIIIDLKSARNEARQFWLLRYASAHPGNLPVTSAIGFIDTICGAGLYMDQNLICYCNDHKDAILQLTIAIEALINAESNQKVA